MTDIGSNVIGQDINPCNIISGIIDQIRLRDLSNREFKHPPNATVSPAIIVQAMILKGLGWMSAAFYLFSKFFVGKATEHRVKEWITPPATQRGDGFFHAFNRFIYL